MSEQELISLFKQLCDLYPSQRQYGVKFQFNRSSFEIACRHYGIIRVYSFGVHNFDTTSRCYHICWFPKFASGESKEVIFELSKAKYDELMLYYYGEFRADMEYLIFMEATPNEFDLRCD